MPKTPTVPCELCERMFVSEHALNIHKIRSHDRKYVRLSTKYKQSVIIRISKASYDGLQKLAKPFTDTPNSVIERLLGINPTSEV